MTLKELAELVRRGEVTDGPLADYQAAFDKERKIFRKKDD
ncbi:hypothetical protein BKA25_004710 [Actinoalloteichus hymeniacidonis]|nr:hypothetical protein [Actinoalloteichus hymeniacidonis]